uniref:Uncharacterized protein n=1 Tax=Picea glauca TaxID=3330 RepID=A0A101LTN1_PICGL|nr:hypothetical protein ABT39_MTgene3634 [Picea glauca]
MATFKSNFQWLRLGQLHRRAVGIIQKYLWRRWGSRSLCHSGRPRASLPLHLWSSLRERLLPYCVSGERGES